VQPSNQYLFTFAVIPALLLLSPFLGVRHWIRRRWFGDAALCFDLGGITFASSRGASGFVINLTWTLLPLLLGIPFVKGAQAMGPFDRWYLRSAPWILRRAKHLHARGAHTWRILRQHRVSSRVTPDVAFLLEAEPTAVPQESYVCLVPSSVVRQRYDDVHGEGSYIALLAGLARHLLARGESILIVPHCYRDGEGENSNDVPLCKALHAALDGSGVSLYPSAGKTPGELKFVLGQSVAVISSRFHAMVAALSMQVPVVVTSWSHKYREVLDMFDMGKWAYDWRELNLGALCSGVDHLLHDRENLRKEIGRRLPAVRADARANFACLPERTVALPR
jgi:polysaccharide pyruvyl transferase WcaK-like protein